MPATKTKRQLQLLQGFTAVRPITRATNGPELTTPGGVILPDQMRLKQSFRGEVMFMSKPWVGFGGAPMSWEGMEVGDVLIYDGQAGSYDWDGERLEIVAPNRVVGFEKNPHRSK